MADTRCYLLKKAEVIDAVPILFREAEFCRGSSYPLLVGRVRQPPVDSEIIKPRQWSEFIANSFVESL